MNFNLVNEQCFAVCVVSDTECQIIPTKPNVLSCPQQHEGVVISSVEKKKADESVTSSVIREICGMWQTEKFCRKTHSKLQQCK